MDPGGLKGCQETKLVLLAGERMEVQSLACTVGGEVGVVKRGGRCGQEGGGCGHETIT